MQNSINVNVNKQEQTCDTCCKREALTDNEHLVIEKLEELLDSETVESLADYFANQKVCLICYLEYAVSKEKQMRGEEEQD